MKFLPLVLKYLSLQNWLEALSQGEKLYTSATPTIAVIACSQIDDGGKLDIDNNREKHVRLNLLQ